MACGKWEEIGLLYSSEELESADCREFEEHVAQCEECRNESLAYKKERELYFTTEILGEAPSQKVDQEILRVCSTYKKSFTQASFISLFVRKSAVSLAFFVVGFVIVGYLVFNVQDAGVAKSAKNSAQRIDSAVANAVPVAGGAVVSSETPDDSIQKHDSVSGGIPYSPAQGNLNLKGVVPVDLKSK